jgi:hypothetical protein
VRALEFGAKTNLGKNNKFKLSYSHKNANQNDLIFSPDF